MSTTQEHYVVFGIDLNEEEIDNLSDDFWENDEIGKYCHKDGFQGFNLIFDGCSGRYAVFGHVLSYGDEFEGMDFGEFSIDYINELCHDGEENYSLVSTFNRLFGQKKDYSDLKLFTFTHWS